MLIILFQNILFYKEFIACCISFGLFTIINKGLGLAFVVYFPHDFSKKCSLLNTPWIDNISMKYLFFLFSRYQTKCEIKFIFRQLTTSWTLGFIFIILSCNNQKGKKEEKTEIQKFKYIQNEKSFLDDKTFSIII